MKDKKELDQVENMEKNIDFIINNGLEPEALSEIQQNIQKYDINDKDPFNPYVKLSYSSEAIENALVHLKQIRVATELLLHRSLNTFRAAKFSYIFSSTLNLIKWNILQQEYNEVISNSEHINIYLEDAVSENPDNFNIISQVCDIFHGELVAKLELGKSVESNLNTINDYIQYLIVAANKDKYKLNAVLIIGQIADTLLSKQMYYNACNYYSYYLDIISHIKDIDNSSKRDLAVFLGHYNVAMMNCESKDWNTIKENIDKEVKLYEEIDKIYGDVRSKMDLAIAYSHLANFFEKDKNYNEIYCCHIKKIQLIEESFFLENQKSEYPVEARIDSVINSMQPIINYVVVASDNEKILALKNIINILESILSKEYNIKLLQFFTTFAMEGFKNSNNREAEFFLFKKINALLKLVNLFGLEDGIKDDLEQTIEESRLYAKKNWCKFEPLNKDSWIYANQVLGYTINTDYKQKIISFFKKQLFGKSK